MINTFTSVEYSPCATPAIFCAAVCVRYLADLASGVKVSERSLSILHGYLSKVVFADNKALLFMDMSLHVSSGSDGLRHFFHTK